MIQYTYTNTCGSRTATTVVTVNPLPTPPAAIAGTATVCAGGATTTLSDATAGGTWSAVSGSGTATAGSATGIVTGVAAGTSLVSYTIANACGVAASVITVTINPLPATPAAITGSASVCEGGAAVALSDITPGGAWSSGSSSANVGSATGLVTGVLAGSATISYTVSNTCGNNAATKTVSVLPLPVAGIITGPNDVCTGATISLTDASAGGTWSRTNSKATVLGGMVTGVLRGIDTINYVVANTCGTATESKIVSVDSVPDAGTITGAAAVCAGASITLSDATPGGGWTSRNSVASVSGGVVTGVSAGIDTIVYTIYNICGSAHTEKNITVNPALPDVGTITGPESVCVGSKITLTDPVVSGGAWSSSNGKATVSGGVVTGITADTSISFTHVPDVSTISYSITNACGTASATRDITIYPLPHAFLLSGGGSLCVGDDGVYVFLSGADLNADVYYELYNDTTYVTARPGLGYSFNFGLQSVAGKYTAIATSRITGCSRKMPGSATVTVLSQADCKERVTDSRQTDISLLKVYPNPNRGSFTMNLLSGSKEQVQVTITNMLGQKVKEFITAANHETEVRLDQPAGIYVLTAIAGDRIYTEKVTVE